MKKPIFIVVYVMSAVCIIHTINNSNFESSIIWKYDSDNKNMIVSLEKASNGKAVKLGISWIFEPSLNYYKNTNHLNWLCELNREGLNGDYNFYYITEYDYKKLNIEKKRK